MTGAIGIEVGRDVSGQIAVGHHVIQVAGSYSTVTVVQSDQLPTPVPREDVTLLPRPALGLVGREDETADVVRMVDRGSPVQLHGAAGIGKSTLLRRVAHRMAEDGQRVVFLSATGRELGDVLQDIFEACYEAPGYRPGRAELRALMAGHELRLLLDDVGCPAAELDELLDAAPSATYLMTATERTLWGEGLARRLGGLGQADSVELLERTLARDLDTDELPAAKALWRLTEGAPLQLLAAAAVAYRSGGPLPRPAQVSELLPLVVERLSVRERAVRRILALAGDGGTGPGLLSVLLPQRTNGELDTARGLDDMRDVCDRLVAAGLAVETDHGYRWAPGVPRETGAGSEADVDELMTLCERLRHWAAAPERTPADLAAAAELVAGVVGAVSAAGHPAPGARLARAAAPGAALSLRMGAWGRILEQGGAAARKAGDRPLIAYFTHEDGIRRLVTGKRVAAAAALALAATLWHELGNQGGVHAAEHGTSLCQPGSLPTDVGPHGGGHTTGHGPASSSGQAQVHGHGPATTAKAAASKLGIGAKVVLGGGLAATVAGGTVLGLHSGGGDTVPVKVHVVTSALRVTMPGTPQAGCRQDASGTDCTTVVKTAKGRKGPVSVDPAGTLPVGTRILYWGCEEGPAASSCTITADKAKTVCVSTDSSEDASGRASCGSSNPSDAKPVTYPYMISMPSNWRVTVTGAAGKCFHDTFDAHATPDSSRSTACGPFRLAVGDSVRLTAVIDGPDPYKSLRFGQPEAYDTTPVWYGCDEGRRSATCTFTMTDKRITAFKTWQKSSDAQSGQHLPLSMCVTTAHDLEDASGTGVCEALTTDGN
ncbi:ATP-binding protein [Streptomyces sp. NPDC008092]|uniref:ATP-binding protein n=1 Tax=Streptomyces sp. NPDC008092 TaxID=3364808 RepID=UPI0036E8DB7C